MSERQGTSPWVWVGCGCGIAVLVGVAALVALGFLGARKAREIRHDMTDPESRTEKVLGVLGTDAVPDGYYPMIGLSIPFLMDMAILSDLPVKDDGEPQGFDKRGFIYIAMISLGRQQKELRDFFAGRTESPDVLRRQRINLDIGERLANGKVERPDAEVLWVAHRGDVDVMGSRSEGITTLILIDCPQDRRMRMGIWFGPEPAVEAAVEAAAASEAVAGTAPDLTGTNADQEVITRFLAHMRPCG